MNLKDLSLYNVVGLNKIETPLHSYEDIRSNEFIQWLYDIDAMLYEELCFEAMLIPCSPLLIKLDTNNLSECFVGYAIGCDFEQINDDGEAVIINRVELNDAIYFCDRLIIEDSFKQGKANITSYFNEQQIDINNINKIYILFSQGVFNENNDEIEYFLEMKDE